MHLICIPNWNAVLKKCERLDVAMVPEGLVTSLGATEVKGRCFVMDSENIS